MSTNPTLLIFAAGVLVGAAIVLFAELIPDVVFIAKYIAARRREQGGTGPHLFLG